ARSKIVLCIPPFEDFSYEERKAVNDLRTANKAVEILMRVLRRPPTLLGFVLPRVFRNGQSYRDAQRQIAATYRNVDILELPEDAFAHSQVEPVLLIAHGA